jgi:hypothetical protein
MAVCRASGQVKIYVYPADQAGCGKYRMYWPAEALQAQGCDMITVVNPGDTTGIGGRLDGDTLVEAHFPDDAEIVVLQRPCSQYLTDAIPLMQAKGVVVVVDMDDDLASVHPSNPAFQFMHPKRSPTSNWHHVARACKMADLVTVSTPQLAERYGAHGRVAILPNCVPGKFLKVEHEDNDEVGWAGALHSHPTDPQAIGAGLRLAGLEHCRIIGPAEDGLDQAFSIQCEADGLIPFDIWPNAVTRLGVGLAPLADTRFNQAKSWLKPLEYAACGVPWVGSDLPEYRRFFNLTGSGHLAIKPKNWAAAIKRLRRDAAYRHDQSAAGRMVAAEWTIEGNAWRWLEAWDGAHAARR